MNKIICFLLIFMWVFPVYADDVKGGWNDVTMDMQIKGCVTSLVGQLEAKIKRDHQGEVLPGNKRDLSNLLNDAEGIATSYCECLISNVSTKWSRQTYHQITSAERDSLIKDLYCSGTCTLDADVELMKCD